MKTQSAPCVSWFLYVSLLAKKSVSLLRGKSTYFY